jgi:hypothetical protein
MSAPTMWLTTAKPCGVYTVRVDLEIDFQIEYDT